MSNLYYIIYKNDVIFLNKFTAILFLLFMMEGLKMTKSLSWLEYTSTVI